MTESRRRLARAAIDILGWSVSITLAACAAVLFSRFTADRAGTQVEIFYLGIVGLILWCMAQLAGSVGRFIRLSRLAARFDMDAREREAATLPMLSDYLTRGQRGWMQHSAVLFVAIVLIGGASRVIQTWGTPGVAGESIYWVVFALFLAAVISIVGGPWRKGRPALPPWLSAYPLRAHSRPDVVNALGQACVAVGITTEPLVYAVPVESVNAFVEGSRETTIVVGLTHGMLRVMYPDELVAIFADLLVRVEPGLVSFAGTTLVGLPVGIPGLQDVTSTIDLLAACDDAAVLATRDPGPLTRALKRTAAAESTSLPGLAEHFAAFLWTSPASRAQHEGPESVEKCRLELLRPVAGMDSLS